MTNDELIEELTYSSYKFNRKHSPDITPERWAKIFPDAAKLEERYQKELVNV